MTSSCIKLKILLLSPSETEKANLINLLHFWSRNEDIITCLQQRKGVLKSKYLDGYVSEESKLEAQKQQPPKTYNFKIEDVEKNKRFEIKLVDDPRQFKEGDFKEIQSFLAKKSDMDGILIALKGNGSETSLNFEEVFQISKHSQLIILVNGKQSDLKFIDNSKDIFCYWNEILDVNPEILMNDSEKQKEIIQMYQTAKETLLEIFRKLWSNALNSYQEHKVAMKKGFIRRKFQIVNSSFSDKNNRIKRIKSQEFGFFILPHLGVAASQLKLMKYYPLSLQKRMHLQLPGNQLKVSEANMFRKVFSGLKSIQVLKFVWPNMIGSPLICNKIVSKGLRKLSLLKSFSLQYTKHAAAYTGENNDLENIETALKRFKRLKSFSVTLSGITYLKKGDLDYFSDGLRRLKSLREVDINFNGTYNSMNQSRMTEISEGLSKFPHLKGLKILMHGSLEFDDVGMKILCDNLSLHTGLQRLFLDLSGSAITQQGFQMVYRVLQKFPDLTNLTLLFVRKERISHDDFQAFCESLRGLRSLEELNLNFSFCPLLTRESLSCLRETFESLTDIHSSSLLFVWCKKISSDDVKDFKKSLLELRPFKNLVVRT